MLQTERDIQRKLRILKHVEQIGDVSKTCRYFGIGRASFYRWQTAFRRQGESGLANRKTIPKNPANRTASEIAEKVLHLRQTYHPGPIRIVWYLARYHDIKISGAGVYRILRRHGLSKPPPSRIRCPRNHCSLMSARPFSTVSAISDMFVEVELAPA